MQINWEKNIPFYLLTQNFSWKKNIPFYLLTQNFSCVNTTQVL